MYHAMKKIENDNKTKKGIANLYGIAKKACRLEFRKELKHSPYMSKDKPVQIDTK